MKPEINNYFFYYFVKAFLVFFSISRASAQIDNKIQNSGIRYSVGISSQIYIGARESNFNLSLATGIFYKTGNFTPSTQIFFNFYNGGLGTSLLSNLKLPFYNISNNMWDIVVVPTITLGIGRQPIATFIRPINFMSSPVVYHHYAGSISLSHNLVFNKYKRNQRSGSINLNIGGVSLGYFNDVMSNIFTFEGLGMGDNHDRYWTGGGFISYRFNRNLEFFYEFDRFTGFGGKLFEISNILRLNNLFYKSDTINSSKDIKDVYKNQMYFNRGLISFGIRTHQSANFNWFIKYTIIGDHKSDVQNLIHRHVSKNPVHNTQTLDLPQIASGFQYIPIKISPY